MNTSESKLARYMDAGFPILMYNTYDEPNAVNTLANLDDSRTVIQWSEIGMVVNESDANDITLDSMLQFLVSTGGEDLNSSIVILKDIRHHISNPKVIGLLKYIAQLINTGGVEECTLFLLGENIELPVELEPFVTIIDEDAVKPNEIALCIEQFCNEQDIPVDNILKGKLVNAFRGLSKYEIENILALSYADDGEITSNDLELVLEQKKQIVKKSGVLEMIALDETMMVLPASISVVRPLIDLSINEVESFLSQEGIKVKRINSTGDKYFEYHREGCPIQFADIGVELDETLFSDLKIYNDAITDFARKNNILASIHMPSTFIITIPTGYETKAIKSLQEKGLHVNELANSSSVDFQSYHSHIYELNSGLNNSIVYEKIFNRLKERLELFGQCNHIYQNDNQISCSYKDKNNQLKVYFDFDTLTADIVYSFSDNSTARIEIELFDNLMLELFRTRKYKVSKL